MAGSSSTVQPPSPEGSNATYGKPLLRWKSKMRVDESILDAVTPPEGGTKLMPGCNCSSSGARIA
jgi:hypothetical protein